MADNKTFKDSTNTTFTAATKQAGGVDYSRVVPVWDEGGTLRDVSDAKPLPVSVTGGGALTDTQLRATPVPVSVSGVATAANQASELTLVGAVTETAPGTDTASSGLNGRLQRIAQRLTSLIALLPTALTGSGNLKAAVVEMTAALPAGTNNIGDVDVLTLPALPAGNNNIGDVDIASLPLPPGASTETTLGTRLSESDFDTKTGALTETAPASDTASSGLNGRLQRIAQRISSLIALIPTALTGSGNFKAALVESTATITTKETRSATPGQSSVAGNASNVTLLASNANRLGATIFNDSTAILYVKLGATASATSFTIKMQPDGYFEVPFGYTGIIDGLWASATGSARMTELTA